MVKTKKISLMQKKEMYHSTPQRFMFQIPIKDIKVPAMIRPYIAGIQSPNFFVSGENTPGNVNTIHK